MSDKNHLEIAKSELILKFHRDARSLQLPTNKSTGMIISPASPLSRLA